MSIRNLIFTLVITLFSLSAWSQNNLAESQEKMDAALNIITTQYVDQLDDNKVVEDGIKGILKQLDPHSSYISASHVEEETQKLASEFEGIGIQFNILHDTIIVISPIAGGPSEKLGILSGDKIIKINDENVAGTGIENQGVRDRLLGDKGTKVNVSIKRYGVKELLDFTITRDKIPMYSLDAQYMVTPETGYIKVNRFAAGTADEFRDALKDLESKGMEHLILDLTGNGGGYLYAAFEMADEFLDWGKMIVYTEGNASPKRELRASSRGNFESGKLIVLIDEGSASASEIVTGAVQDWDRGLVIGRRSFGKGLVQKPYKLPDGSEIRLTIARYYTPTGRSIQKPYDEGKEAYYKETFERFEKGQLTSLDSVHFPDSLKYYTPNHRTVYGGGGIMPDIFIGLDTTQSSDYLRTVTRKGIPYQFALEYVDRNREELNKKYKDVAEFKRKFDRKKVVDEFVEFAEKKGVEKDEEGLKRSEDLLEYQISALVARNMFNVDAYYEVFNEYREDFQKAVEVIQKDEVFSEMRVQKF